MINKKSINPDWATNVKIPTFGKWEKGWKCGTCGNILTNNAGFVWGGVYRPCQQCGTLDDWDGISMRAVYHGEVFPNGWLRNLLGLKNRAISQFIRWEEKT
jgi:hypothetical protein